MTVSWCDEWVRNTDFTSEGFLMQIKNLMREHYESFMPLTEELWEALASTTTAEVVEKGSRWLERDQVCRTVAFVSEGLFRLFYEQDGNEVVAGFFYAPGFVTEYRSFVTQTPSRMVVQALEPSRVLCTSFDQLQDVYRQFPEGERLGRLIAERLFVDFSNRTATLMLDTPEQRYRAFEKRSPHLLQRVPLYMIASYLGMTPETLSRIRAKK